MVAKVINIMAYPPAYELFEREPRPEINWNTPDGRWIGMWGLDVPDILGAEILSLTDKFAYEVWQMDLRADKIYTHRFCTGVVHRLFPAIKKREIFGLKVVDKIRSSTIIKKLLKQAEEENIIVHLNGDSLLYQDHSALLSKIPTIVSYRGVIHMPSTRFFSHTKNIPSKLNHLRDYYVLKKNVNRVDYITYQNDKNLDRLKSIYNGSLQKVTSGCDFSFWHLNDRLVSRKKLGLPINKRIFFCASLLIGLKQIDKLISVFTQLGKRYDFLLIIAGHGLKTYEDYLRDISSDLLEQDRIRFVGFLSGIRFRRYYNASDFFVSTSKQEGGPVTVMQAFACEIPVITTRTGHTAELMEQHNCGCLLDIYDYEMWRNKIELILKDELIVKRIDRRIAKKHYDWRNIAQEFLAIYESLAGKYYS